jgi:hypothetical protein
MAKPQSLELSIIRSAQVFVDAWIRDSKRGPFDPTLAAAAVQWDDDPGAELHREAFLLVAKAIRAGSGHDVARPGPLLDIVREALGYGAPRS